MQQAPDPALLNYIRRVTKIRQKYLIWSPEGAFLDGKLKDANSKLLQLQQYDTCR